MGYPRTDKCGGRSILPPNVLEENWWHLPLSASTGTHQNSVGRCLTLSVVTS